MGRIGRITFEGTEEEVKAVLTALDNSPVRWLGKGEKPSELIGSVNRVTYYPLWVEVISGVGMDFNNRLTSERTSLRTNNVKEFLDLVFDDYETTLTEMLNNMMTKRN